MKVIPTYSLASSVYCDAACTDLARIRDSKMSKKATGGPLEADVWHITNNLQDVILPGIHLLFWGFILILIEKKVFGWLRRRPNKPITQEAK